VAELLWDHSAPARADVRPFADAFIFNCLVAGTDAHAETYSLLLSVNSAAQQSSRSTLIAPVADTRLTDHHAKLTPAMTQHIRLQRESGSKNTVA
jgi:serine/threonine-protein kinase HipA